ncbi:S9 family peptidase [Rossellomorea sp. KS-H15a]|uniref:alpha/beta hydrolase family protein n=1 Tax=Rossellomorea sp. KS-H15a TaxID=2963940 RepID=UPI0020C63344|nr:dienelactone hydrolase family protein [Rossellomorea sp. KS-H15a]UTE77428.1 dienelactone hydrolase family protein [Rossellomorea sp. KS-H15a]
MYSLIELAGKGIPSLLDNIVDLKRWETKREGIVNTWLETLGGIPPLTETMMEVVALVDQIDHYLVKVRYSTVFDDRIPANLLIPKSGRTPILKTKEEAKRFLFSDSFPQTSSFPAVLALHPTVEMGKDAICLESGTENRQYGLELVKKGYVVLAPDSITAGERVSHGEQPFHTASFYKKHPEWSAVGKMIADHRQGISLLESFSFVDRSRIGVIGHSLGGYNAFFLAGVDTRIKAVVCSCGFSTLTKDPERHRWGRREWFTHIPLLSDYIKRGVIPFEFHEILALTAPTPLFIWMGQNDQIFPHWQPAAQGLVEVHSLYDWLNEREKYTSFIGHSGHDFPPEIRGLAYSFLDHWLYAGTEK